MCVRPDSGMRGAGQVNRAPTANPRTTTGTAMTDDHSFGPQSRVATGSRRRKYKTARRNTTHSHGDQQLGHAWSLGGQQLLVVRGEWPTNARLQDTIPSISRGVALTA